MLEIDRWAMARYAAVAVEDDPRPTTSTTTRAIYQAANAFITVDLSAFYVDVTKDRMYTFGATSEARRSGQTAMYLIVDGLARLLAPILPFTMDEVWRNLPGARETSVHLALFPQGCRHVAGRGAAGSMGSAAGSPRRGQPALEDARQHKVITSNLSAHVDLEAPPEPGAGARRRIAMFCRRSSACPRQCCEWVHPPARLECQR